MEERIEDLHGNIFQMGDFSIGPGNQVPIIFSEDEVRIFTKDLLSNESFILVKSRDGKKYGYMFYVNKVWVYGLLKFIEYKPKNDIRVSWQKTKK